MVRAQHQHGCLEPETGPALYFHVVKRFSLTHLCKFPQNSLSLPTAGSFSTAFAECSRILIFRNSQSAMYQIPGLLKSLSTDQFLLTGLSGHPHCLFLPSLPPVACFRELCPAASPASRSPHFFSLRHPRLVKGPRPCRPQHPSLLAMSYPPGCHLALFSLDAQNPTTTYYSSALTLAPATFIAPRSRTLPPPWQEECCQV